MGNIGITRDHIGIDKLTFPHLRGVIWPLEHEESPYPPLEGFPNGRKEKGLFFTLFSLAVFIIVFEITVMIATEEEMNSAKLHPRYRDYCAHRYLELQGCLKINRPLYWRCKHERHTYSECQFADMVIRMKEWERERRLQERELRAAAAAN